LTYDLPLASKSFLYKSELLLKLIKMCSETSSIAA
jgi:hypothetical protein